MHEEDNSSVEVFDLKFESYSSAVSCIMSFGRRLWYQAVGGNGQLNPRSFISRKRSFWVVGQEETILDGEDAPIFLAFLRVMEQRELCEKTETGEIGIERRAFHPLYLVRTFLGSIRSDSDLKYFVRRNIRQFYNCTLSPQTAWVFHLLAATITAAVTEQHGSSRKGWDYSEQFVRVLKDVLADNNLGPVASANYIALFDECCRMTGYISAYYESPQVEIRSSFLAGEFLLSHLFGLPTSIKGFDELFGGGGLILTETVPSVTGVALQLGGRTTLVVGRFGTGKTLLALQLCLEVARKGGLSWISSLEQSPSECLYSLESIGVHVDERLVTVAKDLDSADEVLQRRDPTKGALILIKVDGETHDRFLESLEGSAAMTRGYPLRMICVDPVNSIGAKSAQNETDSVVVMRAKTMGVLNRLEKEGLNTLFVAEDPGDGADHSLYEQNIADTVIHLSVDKRHDYARRLFEIRKSRYQREQRGEHVFSIKQAGGITIYPSSAAFRTRIRARRVQTPGQAIRFGLKSLDQKLGSSGVNRGDVLVLQGPAGSFKSLLGIHFLLGSDQKGQTGRSSLLISVRDDESKQRNLLNQVHVHSGVKRSDDVIIRALPKGFVTPGLLLQLLDDVFQDAALRNIEIDRVMVDDVSHWEMSCPLVQEDRTFGDTLLDFLRRQPVTSLFTCGDLPVGIQPVVEEPIIESADCLIKLERFQFRGMHRVALRLLKTSGREHRRELFELSNDSGELEIKPGSSLLRIGSTGNIELVKTRLLLHHETKMQEVYNKEFAESLKAILTTEIEIEAQSKVINGSVIRLNSSSALDELQVVQMDEFQLERSFLREPHGTLPLREFLEDSLGDDSLDDFLPALAKRTRSSKGKFCAVPFYENVSLLAYRKDLLPEGVDLNSWESLAEACLVWDLDDRNEPPFFDFPRVTRENYNCLFFEILLALGEPPHGSGVCHLREWLAHPNARKAASLLRILCRRANARSNGMALGSKPEFSSVDTGAVVWRHWYTTLNQMLLEMPLKERTAITVTSLPGRIAMAGEWYLAVPSHSAAVDVGLEIIKLLISREAEMERMAQGVGLPTRSKFYTESQTDGYIPVSPYFSMAVGEISSLVSSSFRRSSIGCYTSFSRSLGHHLQRIIEIPESDEKGVADNIESVFNGLQTSMNFISSEDKCEKCQFSRPG